MIQKGAAALAVLALVALSSPIGGQTNRPPATSPSSPSTLPNSSSTFAPGARPPQAAPSATPAAPGAVAPGTATTPAQTNCPGGNCDVQVPRIAISTPAPAPAPWPWQQRIAWGADLVLVVLTYVAITMAISLLRKIERQGNLMEEAVQSAADCATAAMESARTALKMAEAKERAERPWVVMSVRANAGVENAFTVVATNRGRAPARILSTVDETVCAVDEKHLDATPTFKKIPGLEEPIILLPDEAFELISFNRTDVMKVCETDERMKRVESWSERIYLYGKVTYRDLNAPDDAPELESSWLCWYIHGRQKSGMVMAGSPAYNRHT